MAFKHSTSLPGREFQKRPCAQSQTYFQQLLKSSIICVACLWYIFSNTLEYWIIGGVVIMGGGGKIDGMENRKHILLK